MLEKCSVCDKNARDEARWIIFSYKGFDFKVYKLGYKCADCEKKETIKNFEEYREELVEIKSGKLVVNWALYSELSRTAREETYSEKRVDKMKRILNDLNILSFEDGGNWLITDGNLIQLNPSSVAGIFYFTRREDAVEYARLNYSRTHYGWHIQKIGEVISKDEVLKTKPT